MNCTECGKNLVGLQRKFCSTKCKNNNSNNKHQNYAMQQVRGRMRKLELIEQKGGQCETCGYKKNHASLCFHHIDESQKSFQITIRECSNNKPERLLVEAEKCMLLCHNCHMELHYPSCSMN